MPGAEPGLGGRVSAHAAGHGQGVGHVVAEVTEHGPGSVRVGQRRRRHLEAFHLGAHEAGASLRAMEELYRDLVKDEIKLRLAVDGSDQVGVGKPFGVLLSLRFTNSVDRETGGFGFGPPGGGGFGAGRHRSRGRCRGWLRRRWCGLHRAR